MDKGPVPSSALHILDGALGTQSHAWRKARPLFEKYLCVIGEDEAYPEFVAKCEPDLEVLSTSDIEELTEVAKRLGQLAPLQLSNLAHEEPDYAMAEKQLGKAGTAGRATRRVPMPFLTFFMNHPEAEQVKRLVIAHREDALFIEKL